jgi:hypothetical protein
MSQENMGYAFGAPITIAVLIASLLAGCGDDGGSNGTTTTATTTTTPSAVCAHLSETQSAASALKQLDPSTASASDAKQAIFNLVTSAQALSSAASEPASQAKASLRSALSSFQSELKSASDQPVSQQLVTLGTAIGELEKSLRQATAQFNCNQ